MIFQVEYFYADWCGPCQRMSTQKKRLMRYCMYNNIPMKMHKAPEDDEGKAKFRDMLKTRGLVKIPSVIFTFESGIFKTFHNLNENMWVEVFKFLENVNFNAEDENDDF